MARFLLLLKGINVGRANRIPMAELRELLTGLGGTDVLTHLQSGNAVLTHPATASKLTLLVEAALAEFGVPVKVVLRTRAQVVAAIAQDPFGDEASDPARHLLGFFSHTPAPDKVEALEQFVKARQEKQGSSDHWKIVGDHVYLWCPNGVLHSLFDNVDWDRKLDVVTTMRNWTTATRLLELAS